MFKYFLILLVAITLGSFGFIIYKANSDLKEAGIELSPFNLAKQAQEEELDTAIHTNDFPLGNPINILLLGIDRRSRSEGFRTDIMVLVSINPDKNKVTLASLPRDLWYGGGRLNALYLQSGWEALQSAVHSITGLKPERFILTDFKDFSWLVDSMGGVPVNIETTFTDSDYPVDETYGYQTVTFSKGPELLTGARALIFSRSRKGDYDNGDWGRMKRQHLILKGMLEGVIQPKSIFNPMVVEKALTTVTQGKLDTNLELKDAKYLWDFHKDRSEYEIISLYLDGNYLFTPPADEYGGAWVLAPIAGTYKPFKDDLYNALYDIQPPVATDSTLETVYNSTDL